MVSGTNWGVVKGAAATLCAVSCKDGDGDEACAEEDVKKKAEKSEEGDAPKEASEDDGERSIDDRSSGHALNRLFPSWNGTMVMGQICSTVSHGVCGLSTRVNVHARYHEKAPRTMAEIANSMRRRNVEAARVPRASLDMLMVSGELMRDESERLERMQYWMKELNREIDVYPIPNFMQTT